MYEFTTTTSSARFVLNTDKLTQPEAEAVCNSKGGHLAYYRYGCSTLRAPTVR